MEGHSSNTTCQIVAHPKDNKMLSKGYLYNLVRVYDLKHKVPSIDSMFIVNEFQDVFPNNIQGINP